MKRLFLALALGVVLALSSIAPALAGNQGGISDGDTVARGNYFVPGVVAFPLYCDYTNHPFGMAWFRITWCSGYIAYRIDVPVMNAAGATLTIHVEDGEDIVVNPLSLAGKPTADGLHAEGFVYLDGADLTPLYEKLESGDAWIQVTGTNGSVSGSTK